VNARTGVGGATKEKTSFVPGPSWSRWKDPSPVDSQEGGGVGDGAMLSLLGQDKQQKGVSHDFCGDLGAWL